MLETHVYEILVEVQEPSGGQTEGMRRGLSKNTQQRLRVIPSKMEPYEAHVAICSPCTWPWCHEGRKATWKERMETSGSRGEVFTFLCSCSPHHIPFPEAGRTTEQEMLHMFLTEDTCRNVCTSPSREGSSGHMGQIGLITHWCSCRNGRR